jgi:Flp pilus assembly protein TadG
MVLPLLLILVFGVVEWGWLFTKAGEVSHAAREAARVGARAEATPADIQAAVDAVMARAGMSGSGYTTSITHTGVTGSLVTVEIIVPYRGGVELTGFPLVPVPAQLRSQVSMAKEGP